MSRSASAIPLQIEGHSELETEIVTNLMTEGEVSKRFNLSMALLRRWPSGRRGVVLHDRFDHCSYNRHGQRPIGGRVEKSYCTPWMELLGIRNQQGAGSELRRLLISNISGYVRSSRLARRQTGFPLKAQAHSVSFQSLYG